MPWRADSFITQDRLRTWAIMLASGYALTIFALIVAAHRGVDPGGIPLGADFVQFYAAGRMAIEGRAVEVFEFHRLQAEIALLFPAATNPFLWNYPPVFLLIILPFSTVPYFPALIMYSFASYALYLWAAKMIIAHRLQMLLTVAVPGAFLVTIHGQNTFLAVFCLAAGFCLLGRRPMLAGFLFGLVSYKPHLGLILPLVLAAGRYWQAFVSALVTVVVLTLVSGWMFGVATWAAFLRNLPEIAAIVRDSPDLWPKMTSMFAASRMLGASANLAFALQILCSIGIACVTAWAWAKPGDLNLKIALAMVGTLLLSPYLMNYDLLLVGIPVAIMARRMVEGHGRSDAALLVAVSFAPMALGLTVLTQVQFVTPLLWVFYVAIWIRLRQSRSSSDQYPQHETIWPRGSCRELRHGRLADTPTGSPAAAER